MFPFN